MHIRERLSPNHDARPVDGAIDMLILHYTGMNSAQDALDRLCSSESRVSAHYLIDEDGTSWRLVPEARRAWHAGVSSWAGRRDINAASIGIELVNPGHAWGYRAFPPAQMTALIALCHDIVSRHAIPPRFVLGHSDVAPQRKADPGELFDWPALARAGIGLWPDFTAARADVPDDVASVQRALGDIGYDSPATGVADDATQNVIIAFQRHFRPSLCDGVIDAETRARIAAVRGACS
jgi:N-acetylmuramoyl-L-alanine amidase